MKADPRFLEQPKWFWADVRTVGQEVGYTVRGKGIIRVPTIDEIRSAYEKIGLGVSHLVDENGTMTDQGQTLLDYFEFRANVLNNEVEPRLMNAERAQAEFERLHAEHNPQCPLPMNKQKGEKRAPAFLTCIVNILIEANAGEHTCDYDPRELTTVTRDEAPLRTLARRVDGAFPAAVNPIAVWEIKEYYYTTTFGSRVADGVYETLLDGMELEELSESEGVDVLHYLIVDAHYTWWDCGKSYLCRMIDMIHMGYVDEVLFGYEVIERLPELVQQWVTIAGNR
ncbi:MAG: hypothetical protein ACF8GE_02210 [Phycisphaerales bacterium JB043]